MVINVGDTTYTLDQWQPGQPVIKGAQLAVDTETELIVKGAALKPVLIQVCHQDSRCIQIAQYPHFHDYIRQLLEANPNSIYVFFNAPFDIEAMGLNHDARMLWMVENSRIVDMAIRFILHELQRGTFTGAWSLDYAAKRLLRIIVPKDDEIRLGFTQGMELTSGFLHYAAADAAITAQLFQQLPNALPTEDIQLRGFLALHEASNNGMLVDDKYRLELKQDFERRKAKCIDILRCWGYYPGQAGNTKVLQEAMEVFEKHCGVVFSRTAKKQQIQVNEESADFFEDSNPPSLLTAFQEYAHCNKMVSTYLDEDNIASDRRVHPFFSPLVKTGRTSSSKPNIQNIPRKERIRGIYIAPANHILYAADYSQIELGALAQSCYTLFDQSRMMELLNAGEDIHSWFGEIIKNHDERSDKEKEGTDYRQYAKVCLSEDTELLTEQGWISVKKLYNSETPIMQYCPHTRRLSFIQPSGWIKQYNKQLLEITNDNMNVCVTPDHRLLRISKAGVVNEVLAEAFEANEQYSTVHGGYLQACAVGCNDALTRIAVMIQADGSFTKGEKVKHAAVRLGFSKVRKIKRCRQLLNQAAIPYKETIRATQTAFYIDAVVWEQYSYILTEDKHFRKWTYYDATAFIDELSRWDGRTVKKHHKSYFNTSYEDTVTAQLILVTNGYKTHIHKQLREKENCKNAYLLSWYAGWRKQNPAYCRTSNIHKEKVSGLHTVYCPAVPTTWILTRRRNLVTVVGNCNFGIPGGLGPATLRKTAKKSYDVILSLELATKLRGLWLETFPEMSKHLSPPKDNESPWDSPMYIGRTINGRTRRNATFAAACNYPFQGLVADGAKLALWLLYKEGFKVVSFIHDEIITELARTAKLQQRINRINELMIFAMKRFLPNIKVEVEGVLMSRWYKEAEPVFDADGNLQEWMPDEHPKIPKGRLI